MPPYGSVTLRVVQMEPNGPVLVHLDRLRLVFGIKMFENHCAKLNGTEPSFRSIHTGRDEDN